LLLGIIAGLIFRRRRRVYYFWPFEMIFENVVRGSCPLARRTTSAGEPWLGRRPSLEPAGP
jgi:hypothetical protein